MLRRNTTIEIEEQIEENVAASYVSRLRENNDVFASATSLKEKHYYFHNPPETGAGEPLHMKEIMKELSKTLPKEIEINARGSMFVKFDEDSPQYIKAVLTGIEGTPYASGVFLFDIFLPADYPLVPCHCRHVTPNANLVHANNGPGGFSPNLHSDSGQVCLSLLGTWDGPGWESGVSNIYQVLSTILYMILGAKHPYYMEPDYGGWEGTAPTNIEDDPERDLVIEYDEEVKLFNAKLCILAPLNNPPEGFERLIRTHLYEKRKLIIATLRRWANKGSSSFRNELMLVIKDIEESFRQHITRRYAEEDCLECEELIHFIEDKMKFLTKKIKGCCTPGVCSCSVENSGVKVCSKCAERARGEMPKAYLRYVLGPKLLTKAQRDLANMQHLLKGLPLQSSWR